MKRNIVKAIILLAVFLVGSVFGTPLMAGAAGVWTGQMSVVDSDTIEVRYPYTATDPTISGVTTPFVVASLKINQQSPAYIFNIKNTGATPFTIIPSLTASPTTSVLTAEWSTSAGVFTPASGIEIPSGQSKNITLKLIASDVYNGTLTVQFSK
jgi:hypothetical protein